MNITVQENAIPQNLLPEDLPGFLLDHFAPDFDEYVHAGEELTISANGEVFTFVGDEEEGWEFLPD